MGNKKKVPAEVIGVPDDRAINDTAQFFIALANAGYTLKDTVRFLVEHKYSFEAISEGCRYAVEIMCDHYKYEQTEAKKNRRETK